MPDPKSMASLERELAVANEKVQNLEQAVSKATKAVEEAKAKVKEVDEERTRFMKDLAKDLEMGREAVATVKSLNTETQGLKDQLEKTNDRLNEANKMILELREEAE